MSAEPEGSNSFVDKKIGQAVSKDGSEAQRHDRKGDERTFALAVGGICTVAIVILIAMLATTPSETAASGPLPNWNLQAALPGKLTQPSNRIYLSGNRLLWNGAEVSEANIRTYLAVVTQMRPQPVTILSHGTQVVPGRLQHTRELIDDVLHCKPGTCVEVTAPVEDDGAPPEGSGGRN